MSTPEAQRLVQRGVLAAISSQASKDNRKVISVLSSHDPETGALISQADADAVRAAAASKPTFPTLEVVAAITSETLLQTLSALAMALDLVDQIYKFKSIPHCEKKVGLSEPATLLQTEILELYAPLLTGVKECTDVPTQLRAYFDAVFPYAYSADPVTAVLAALVTRLLFTVRSPDAPRSDAAMDVFYPLLVERLVKIAPDQTFLLAEVATAAQLSKKLASDDIADAVRCGPKDDDPPRCLGPDSFGAEVMHHVVARIEQQVHAFPAPGTEVALIALCNLQNRCSASAPSSAAAALRLMPAVLSFFAHVTETEPGEWARLLASQRTELYACAVHGARKYLAWPSNGKFAGPPGSDRRRREELINLFRVGQGLLAAVTDLLFSCEFAMPGAAGEVPAEEENEQEQCDDACADEGEDGSGTTATAATDADLDGAATAGSTTASEPDAERIHAAWRTAALAAKAAIVAATPASAAALVVAAREVSRRSEEHFACVEKRARAQGWVPPGSLEEEPSNSGGDDPDTGKQPLTQLEVQPDDLVAVSNEFYAAFLALLTPFFGSIPGVVRSMLYSLDDLSPHYLETPGRERPYVRAAALATVPLSMRIIASKVFETATTDAAPFDDVVRFPDVEICADLIRGPHPSITFRARGTAVGLPISEADAALGTDAPDTLFLRGLSIKSSFFDARDAVLAIVQRDTTRAFPPGAELLPALVRAGLFKVLAALDDFSDQSLMGQIVPLVCSWLIVDCPVSWHEDVESLRRIRISRWTAEWAREFITGPLREMESRNLSTWAEGAHPHRVDVLREMLEYMETHTKP